MANRDEQIRVLYWEVDVLQKSGDIEWKHADHIKQALSDMLKEQPCKTCGGSGTVVNPTFGPDDPSQPPYLKCPDCKKEGGVKDGAEIRKI